MSDYLWDKTGERDPEVGRLEEMLGGLRFEPGQLELPAAAAPRPARAPLTLFKWGALAAALALAALAGALVVWSGGGRDVAPAVATATGANEIQKGAAGRRTGAQATTTNQSSGRVDSVTSGEVSGAGSSKASTAEAVSPAAVGRRGDVSPPRRGRPRAGGVPAGGGRMIPASESAERRGIEAKEQLLYALRLTSAKLEEVRRRTQDAGDLRETTPARGRTR